MHKKTQINKRQIGFALEPQAGLMQRNGVADLGRWFSRGGLLNEHISARQVLLAQWAADVAVLEHLDHHAAELGIPALVISLG